MMKRVLALIVVLMLVAGVGLAEERLTINDVGLDLLGCSVHYPQVTGMGDAALQETVNAAILAAGQIENRLNRMAMLVSSPVKLTVSYDCYTDAAGTVLSCAFLADGAVYNNRATQEWSAVTIDLTTGETIGLNALLDSDALDAVEVYLSETVEPDLSAHLAAGSLTPLPEVFTIAEEGLTLYYPIEQFRTLSDRAGTIMLTWTELEQILPGCTADIPQAAVHTTLNADSRDAIAATITEGRIPGIPATIGEGMQGLIDTHRLLNDPDIYEGGRMIALESGAFRQAWVLTDGLRRTFDNSVVQGIRTDRVNLYGLCTGVTTVDEWRNALGAPEVTLQVDAERAESWRIVPGTSDYYQFGAYRLRLHADDSGVLRSVILTN